MWLSTVGLNNVLKGILVVSSLGLFTNTAAGSRPAQLFVQTCIFFPALSSFFFSPPASSFLCPCHPFPLLFPFLLIFFFQSLFHVFCGTGVQIGEVDHIFRPVAPSINVFRTPLSCFCPSSSWFHSVLLSSTATGSISGCAFEYVQLFVKKIAIVCI